MLDPQQILLFIAATLQRNPTTVTLINRLSGMLFICLGARIALQR